MGSGEATCPESGAGSPGGNGTNRKAKVVLAANRTNRYVCGTHGEGHMPTYESGDLAVITARNHFAVMSDAEVGARIYDGVAKLVKPDLGEPSDSEWQVIYDLLEALSGAYGKPARIRPPRWAPRPFEANRQDP